MKTIRQHIAALACITALWGGFSACQDDIDAPGVDVPEAGLEPNTTILELKEKFWDDATNYAKTIEDPDDASKRFIIHGRVISSDEEGNVFKSLIIQDETAAMAFSIDSYNLYLNYRVGQEIVLDVTGMDIGKYAGLEQIGRRSWYENGSSWQVSFMSLEYFQNYARLNGLPDRPAIDTLTVNTFADLSTTPEGLQKWQSQLVRFRNVSFPEGGKRKFSAYHATTNEEQNTTLQDRNGSSLTVRTSGYCTFWNETLPVGNIDLVGILSYYNTAWQIILIDANGVIKVGERPGTKDKPFTVGQAIEEIDQNIMESGWVKGYIVGAVAPEVEEVKSNDDIQWEAPTVLGNTLVIAPDATTRDYSKCLVVRLPMGTALQTAGNLRDHADNLGRQILINGKFGKVFATYGITDVTGKADSFEIEGVVIGGSDIPEGSGSAEAPYNVGQIVAMNPQSTTAAVESGVWVKGYIVGFMPTGGSSTTLAGTEFSNVNAATTNLVLGPTADCTDATKCVGVQLPTSMRAALALANKPDNLGKALAVKGDIMKYCGGPGVKTLTEYKLDGAGNPDVPAEKPEGDGTLASPYNAVKALEVTRALPDQNPTATEYYVKGKILSVSSIDTGNFGNATYTIGDSENGAAFTIFRGYWFNGDKFTAADQLAVGAEVIVLGKLVNYMGNTPEMAQGNKIVSYNGKTGDDTPTPPAEGDGTQANPYTPTKALALATTLDENGKIENVYVKGYVASIKEISTQFGNGTYTIGDTKDAADGLSIYRGYWLNGDKFTAEDQIAKGGEIVVCGTLVNFKGNTPQMTTGSKVISYTAPQGGDTPTPPAGDAVTISATALNVPGTTTDQGYTVVIDKASGTSNPTLHSSGSVRLYADNTIQISGSAKIAKIVFTISDSSKFRYTTLDPSLGKMDPAQASGDTTATWVGDSDSVTFTVGHDATLGSDGSSKRGQVHFTKIEIYTAK